MQAKNYPITQWANDDKPREKMLLKGAEALSDAELLGILIQNGTREASAVDLGKQVMQLGQNNLGQLSKLSLKQLQQIKGIGQAKAIMIAAALELSRRRLNGGQLQRSIISSSKDVGEVLRNRFRDFPHEVFAVVFLNQGNRIIDIGVISQGGITGTLVDVRMVLKLAIEKGATSLILCHNHPSGNLKPSKADADLTKRITAAAQLMDIKVLDHLIVSEEGYYSFADEGNL